MIHKALNYFPTRITLWNRLNSRRRKNPKIRQLGWRSVFPPASNGAAAASYWFCQAISRQLSSELQLTALPLDGRIDKRLFKGVLYDQFPAEGLDAVIFNLFFDDPQVLERCPCPSLVMQTFHDYLDDPQKIVQKYRKASKLLAPTRWAEKLYKDAGHPNTGYLPYGVDSDLFEAKHKPNRPFTVLFVSRIMFYKGIVTFLNSIKETLKHAPEVQFKVIGFMDHADLNYSYPLGNSPQIVEQVQTLIRETEQKYPDNFQMSHCWQSYEQIPQSYQGADLLLFPSHNEGFGVPLIEAMSCQIPCIVSDKPPMNELVIDKQTGFCLKPSSREHGMEFPDPLEVSQTILWAYENPKQFQEIKHQAREHVLKHYSFHSVLPRLIDHIESLNA